MLSLHRENVGSPGQPIRHFGGKDFTYDELCSWCRVLLTLDKWRWRYRLLNAVLTLCGL